MCLPRSPSPVKYRWANGILSLSSTASTSSWAGTSALRAWWAYGTSFPGCLSKMLRAICAEETASPPLPSCDLLLCKCPNSDRMVEPRYFLAHRPLIRKKMAILPFCLQVKQIMEEAVTRKFVHEDSSHIIALCGEWPGDSGRGVSNWKHCPGARGRWDRKCHSF